MESGENAGILLLRGRLKHLDFVFHGCMPIKHLDKVQEALLLLDFVRQDALVTVTFVKLPLEGTHVLPACQAHGHGSVRTTP